MAYGDVSTKKDLTLNPFASLSSAGAARETLATALIVMLLADIATVFIFDYLYGLMGEETDWPMQTTGIVVTVLLSLCVWIWPNRIWISVVTVLSIASAVFNTLLVFEAIDILLYDYGRTVSHQWVHIPSLATIIMTILLARVLVSISRHGPIHAKNGDWMTEAELDEITARDAAMTVDFPVEAAPTVNSPAPASLLENLAKLGDLRDRGILSESEFAEQKALLLRMGS